MPWIQRLGAAAGRPVDAASLVALRTAFGLLLAFAMVRFAAHGWIEDHFLTPERFFTHWGLGWVRPLPGAGMHVVVGATTVAALAIAVGPAPRVAAAVFTTLFTYLHLCDVTHYLNHYVLVSLVGLLLASVPLGRWGGTVPAWWVWLFRFQIGVVYFFGGVGKLNPDWLLRAEPLATWLGRAGDVPVLGAFAHAPWLAFAMSWAGAAFDLSVPFLLATRRTRPFAYAAACAFHLITWRLFPIGMFPFFMMAFGLVFFAPSWPRTVAGWLAGRPGGPAPAVGAPAHAMVATVPAARSPRWAIGAALALVAVEILVPLRGLLYPGDPLWTEQGFRFAWKVMLVEKNGDVVARVTDRATGRTSLVEPSELYTPVQVRMMATQPDLLLQFAHAVRDRERARGRDVEVRLDAFVAMNGRRSQRFVDPSVDLAQREDGLGARDWILPGPAPVSSLLLEQRSSVAAVLARGSGSAQGPSRAEQPDRRQP